MGVLKGTARLFGGQSGATLASEFRAHAGFERREAIQCIVHAIRVKGDVRAAVWFLCNAERVEPSAEVRGIAVGEGRSQPAMLGRPLAVVGEVRSDA